MTDEKKKLDNDLASWRKQHFKELEDNLTMAKQIRDDPEASNRDINEAIKTINALLGVRPDRVDEGKKSVRELNPFTKDEQDDINERVKAILKENEPEGT